MEISLAYSGETMEILAQDLTQWRLRVRTIDDLWVLKRLLSQGKSLAMLGERRDQSTAGDEGGRAKQAERKKMWIQLAIDHVEYASFSDVLRVHGIIEEAPMDLGLHHTHVIQLRDEIVISSSTAFTSFDLDLLQESVRADLHGQVALLVVEADEMILFFVTGRGLRESATWTMRGGGKRGDLKQSESVSSQFRRTVVDGITAQLDAETPLVLCGPGTSRDKMQADLLAAGHRRPMKSLATSMGGRSAANEVLREGLAGQLLAEHQMVQEIALLEEAWKRISTNQPVAYGTPAIKKSIEEGAVDTLLIGVDILRNPETSCEGVPWPEMLLLVEQFSGTIVQCSPDHDAGQQLLGFGGVVALLRYKV